ncbi:MAG: ketoacyl-ACP synthase III [Phycisphaeraceae bacterium]|nr:ketoacyl-ACP synthase III [Phycisphaeraceae bacterium]MCB9847328.1 ketoacyl-ACP synthase III [Phycisphaeraceae bacterium]
MSNATTAADPGTIMPATARVGVEIVGVGSALPEGVLTNNDLSAYMDTSDEWITQRTGIRQRRYCDPDKGEGVLSLGRTAMRRALEDAGLDPSELDLLILASVTGETRCPSTSCKIAAELGAVNAGAFDLMAACSGFVYSMNIASALIRTGEHRTIGVIGCDVMSNIVDIADRNNVVLFGDAAGAAVFRATDDTSKGIIASQMCADGRGWADLHLPYAERDMPEGADLCDIRYGRLQMRGREVFKFAVSTFPRLIESTCVQAGIGVDDVALFISHQSNLRILDASRERLGIPEEKLYVNIQDYGNSSAGSVPLCLDEARAKGLYHAGDLVMFVAFGGGLTWTSSLWRV